MSAACALAYPLAPALHTPAASAARVALAKTGELKITQTVKFAGESVTVSRVVEKGSSEAASAVRAAEDETSLDRLVNGIRNKKGVTAVEKSSYDWDQFKNKDKGLQDELKNATEDGYVEKQDFLSRVDHRRFEIEKADRERQRVVAAARQKQ